MVVKVGFNNAHNTFMGVDNAVVCLSVVLINPHECVLALWNPPIQPRRYQRPPLFEIRDSATDRCI